MRFKRVLVVILVLINAPLAYGQGLGKPPVLEFNQVTASVADIDKEAAWYARVLGFAPGPHNNGPDMVQVVMKRGEVRIDLVQQKNSRRLDLAEGPIRQGWLHVVFRVSDVGATYQWLKTCGTDVAIFRDSAGNIQHLSMHDPEGNEIGIAPPAG